MGINNEVLSFISGCFLSSGKPTVLKFKETNYSFKESHYSPGRQPPLMVVTQRTISFHTSELTGMYLTYIKVFMTLRKLSAPSSLAMLMSSVSQWLNQTQETTSFQTSEKTATSHKQRKALV